MLQALHEFRIVSVKEKLLTILSLIISYLMPIIGFIIIYCQKKKQNSSLIKKASWTGIILAFTLFFLDYLAFILR
ncbi:MULTISPECIES: hypothetical protein [Bacillota]|jgi:amino acid transporter|uniref:Uncharacterized protein n=2 Tax=Amedibacillus TaxID=2749846 RepID=A0A7G9GSQ8_9FIRM|nr:MULTISPECIES: hypothetical protein [Bacillota]QNM13840.1 hypothetical protein H9Q80_07840 [[Eubacterium] hominis]MCH4283866.1 hypothetical protein [Amedibacillus hominis]RGB56753.1 hypothetical protein DW271_06410 [Absiella sp. AM22-9]RGB60807.1 hypothetical protein DW120_08460 [Absiella sp. AM10-20]RGB69168.1 hypothetical protein DW113_02975 [Absiella sp. AM09-45]